jgi:hypothetical protein
MLNDELMIPDFLKRTKADTKKFRAPRWKKMPKAQKPEGERWEKAERWEVKLHDEVPKLGSGQGRKWARLADGGATVKVSMAAWSQVARHGRKL